MKGIVLIYLFGVGILDIKFKKLPLFLLVLGLAGAVVLGIMTGENFLLTAGTGSLPGIFLLVASWLTRGQIGKADGIIFCITGILFGIWNNLFLLLISLILAAVYGGIRLICKKTGRRDEIPFLPFVFLSYFILMLGGSV